ncbi:MAG: serine/threonine-protein kinase [Pseudomonadota bacterium]
MIAVKGEEALSGDGPRGFMLSSAWQPQALVMAPDHAHEVSGDPCGDADLIAGRYELRDQIGAGAFGIVHEVYDRRLGRLAALKTMPIGAVDNPEAAADLHRFHLEAQAVARLSHPGIVTVHDFGETGGNAWIVMELVIGETLKAVLDRGERPSVAECVRVVCDLLDALHYAHGRGIVHRDVKPANILLAVGAEEGLGAVRLADFGIALMGEAASAAPGEMVGTPSTMAPEQLRGDPVDRRADLWAVGTILYELLTGQRAFAGGVPAIFSAILTQQPTRPCLLVPSLPAGFDAVIERALAKAPADRFASAGAMAEAVRAAAAGKPAFRPALPGLDLAEAMPLPARPLTVEPSVRLMFGKLLAAFALGAAAGAGAMFAALRWLA